MNINTIKELEKDLKQCKKHLYNKNNIFDSIEDIKINTNLPLEERALNFFAQISNPYILRVGKVIVQFEFADNTNIDPIKCIDNALINDHKSKIMSKV